MLAVEIVSPTSIAMDRITKPALYAAAGIPYYWRIETFEGLVVHTHTLDPEGQVYRPTGSYEVRLDVPEPWAISIPIERLRPRHMKER
ncbi:hypothetical protein Aiant_48970 [Actinoplanes ianthinogenes]|uniref:Putative restriction endonuclease domain-containing protein n=1 Tax=Actinoplanes ianthinogenes TaxID=122358 RepID=A0ABM7LY49_9ACTN|nr:Uma2 family endonuclease [Actinoplanes ianthinogenes]BCJ44240.1 hypothetical protein Aiant_48970 [Actinoplanes ianthinogenes]